MLSGEATLSSKLSGQGDLVLDSTRWDQLVLDAAVVNFALFFLIINMVTQISVLGGGSSEEA